MGTGHRLTATDASFLHLEKAGIRMHVASVTVFDGPAPPYDELLEHIERRLHLVPRFRQRLAEVPFEQGRPVWVDDPHFNLRYHLRHAGLPAPGDEQQLKVLAGRLFEQPLDRNKPLWEMWLVNGLASGGFALVTKSHHALVDGVSAVDVTTVLFDATVEPSPINGNGRPWSPRPLPSSAQLLSDALLQRATRPGELVRGVRHLVRRPRGLLHGARDALQGMGALAFAGLSPAPETPLNVPIGPHRRYTWVDAELDEFRAIKTTLGGTINDVVLAAVAEALGRFLRHRGVDTSQLVLKALVPISLHADPHSHRLGNEIAPMWVPLPLGIDDPVERLGAIRQATRGLRESREAMGARGLTELASFAPPTIMSQAARLQQRQRFFNVVVTNVPGPQQPLYLLGRRLRALYPVVPLSDRHALGIAVTSYDGKLGFGLLADYDALADLDVLAAALHDSIDALASAAIERRRSWRTPGSPAPSGV